MTCLVFFFALIAVQSSTAHQEEPSWQWALGFDIPPHQGNASLWATGERWGYGLALGGPIVNLSCCSTELYYVSGLFTVQRFVKRIFIFGEAGYKTRDRKSYFEERGGHMRMRTGVGISRRYKDFGVFVSYGFGYDGWDGDGIYERVGLDAYPRVVAYWVL